MAEPAEKLDQDDVAALVAQMQAESTALADDTQAVQQAAASVSEITADVKSVKPAPPAEIPGDSMAAEDEVPAMQPMQATRLPAEVPSPEAHAAPSPYSPEVRQLMSIEVPIIVRLGARRMPVGEVMRFAVGAIIEFHKASDEELELLANNKLIGKGNAVKVGENFGIILTKVGSVKETIKMLGGG